MGDKKFYEKLAHTHTQLVATFVAKRDGRKVDDVASKMRSDYADMVERHNSTMNEIGWMKKRRSLIQYLDEEEFQAHISVASLVYELVKTDGRKVSVALSYKVFNARIWSAPLDLSFMRSNIQVLADRGWLKVQELIVQSFNVDGCAKYVVERPVDVVEALVYTARSMGMDIKYLLDAAMKRGGVIGYIVKDPEAVVESVSKLATYFHATCDRI